MMQFAIDHVPSISPHTVRRQAMRHSMSRVHARLLITGCASALAAVGCSHAGQSATPSQPMMVAAGMPSALTAPPKKCGVSPPTADGDGWQSVPAGAPIECLREVASKQKFGTVVQQTNVPASAPGCESELGIANTTQITVIAYDGVGTLNFDRYLAKDGYIVALIQNNSNCETMSKIKLAPGHQYFWVVEKKKTRLVDVSDGTEIKLSKFDSCKGNNHGTGYDEIAHDVAMLKSGDIDTKCNHSQKPDGLIGFSVRNVVNYGFLDEALIPHSGMPFRTAVNADFSLWISCGGDCCFADGI
jgi:hypothetical protein